MLLNEHHKGLKYRGAFVKPFLEKEAEIFYCAAGGKRAQTQKNARPVGEKPGGKHRESVWFRRRIAASAVVMRMQRSVRKNFRNPVRNACFHA